MSLINFVKFRVARPCGKSSRPNRYTHSAMLQRESNPKNPLFNKARDIARAAHEHDGRALLVGGYVRDELLGLKPKDADLEVYGIEAGVLRQLLRKFGRVDCVGESFRVYKLVWHGRDEGGEKQRYELDVTLPRRDRKVGEGHRGFEVEGDPNATIEDAARRRDFTINAILRDPLTGAIIDPFGGRADLEAGVLQAVDAAHFGEDSLRVLRACQFAARFAMTVESETVALCRSIDLNDLPRERIWGEWEKLLLKAPTPSVGLHVAQQLGVLQQLFPDIETALTRRRDWLCQSLDRAADEKAELDYPRQVTLMLATLGSFLGWRGTRCLLESLGLFTLNGYDVRRQTIVVSGERKRIREWFLRRDTITDRDFCFLAARVEPRLVYHLVRARGDSEAAAWFIEKVRALGVEDGPPPPLLMGRHLLEMGINPGPIIGEITRAVYLMQLSGTVTTLDEAQAAARNLMKDK